MLPVLSMFRGLCGSASAPLSFYAVCSWLRRGNVLCSIAHIRNLAGALFSVNLTRFSNSSSSRKLVDSGPLIWGDGKGALWVLLRPSCCIDIRRQSV